MNYQALYDELQTSAYNGKTAAEALAILQTASVFVPSDTPFISYRTLRDLLGKTKVAAIAAAVAASDPIANALMLVPGDNQGNGGGVNASLPEFQATVDAFVAGNILSAEDGVLVKALGGTKITRAASLGMADVTLEQIIWVTTYWTAYVALNTAVSLRYAKNKGRLNGMLNNLTPVTDLATIDA